MSQRPILHVITDVPELKNIKDDKVKRRAFKKLDCNFNSIDCISLGPAKILSKEEREWFEDKYLPRAPGAEGMPFRGTFTPSAEYTVDKDSGD